MSAWEVCPERRVVDLFHLEWFGTPQFTCKPWMNRKQETVLFKWCFYEYDNTTHLKICTYIRERQKCGKSNLISGTNSHLNPPATEKKQEKRGGYPHRCQSIVAGQGSLIRYLLP